MILYSNLMTNWTGPQLKRTHSSPSKCISPYSPHPPSLLQVSTSFQVWTSGGAWDEPFPNLAPCSSHSCLAPTCTTDPSLIPRTLMTCWFLKSKDTFLYHSVTADTRSYTLHTDASCPVGFAGILGFLPAHRSSLFRLLRVFSPLPDFLQWRVIWNHVLASLFFFPLYPKHFIHDMLKFNVDSWFSNLLYRLLVWKWYKRETLERNVSYRKENLIWKLVFIPAAFSSISFVVT